MYFDNAEGPVYRPPSEADSFILRITTGCSHNQCTFCAMYKEVQFRTRPMEEILRQIALASPYKESVKKVFLADGNALILKTEFLLEIIKEIHKALPYVEHITCYGSTKDILGKGPDELRALYDAELTMVYVGIESGDNEVLSKVNKGVTAEEIIEAGKRLNASGIDLAAMIILGLGGKARSEAHIHGTAQVLNAIHPALLGVLTLVVLEHTPLYTEVKQGTFVPLSPVESLYELKALVENLKFQKPCIFSSSHVSNHLPMTAFLPRDQETVLKKLDQVLSHSL